MKTEDFETLVAPHRDALSRFVSMMVGREAEDIVQEAIAAAFRDLAKFEKRSKFSTWLYGIALNLCRKHLRDKGRHATAAEQAVLDAQPGRGGGAVRGGSGGAAGVGPFRARALLREELGAVVDSVWLEKDKE